MPAPSDPFSAVARLEGVPSAFAATRDGIDSLLRDRGLRRSTPAATAESLLRGAAASAALAGAACDLERLREGDGDPPALAVARMSTELLGLVPVWERAPLQALARLHALAAAGSAPSDDLGRPVNPQGAERLAALARSLQRPTEAPGMVVAAVTHAEVASSGAFSSHNHVVARAAERIVLVATGVDPASLTVPEAGHHAAERAYRARLAGYDKHEGNGMHQWLLYAADAYALGAEVAPLDPPRRS